MWSTAALSSLETDLLGKAHGSTAKRSFSNRSADPLIGREKELATLTGLLFDPTVRILTVTGPAGVGKSRLVRAAAQPSLFDAVATVNLGATGDPATAWRQIADAVGPLPEALTDRFGGHELLLVLDDCDLVAAELSLDLARLSARCRGLRLVLTSRVSLDVYDERLFPVRPFPVPSADCGGTDPESPAVRLFVERARAQRPNYVLLEEDAAVVADICAALDGLPLAIELAAATVGMLGPRELLARLRSGEGPADSRLLDLPPRHRTVADSLAWAAPVLSADHRRCLQQLAVLEGQFDLATAQHVTETSWSRMMRHLEALVHLSLLQRVEGVNGDVGFRMLGTVRAHYLRQDPPEPERLARARDRHAEYFAALAATTRDTAHGTEQVHRLPGVRRRLDDFRAAVGHLRAKGDHPAAVRTLLALDAVLDDLGCLPGMGEHLRTCLGHLESDGHRPLLARALETAAAWALASGGCAEAGPLLVRASELYRSLRDPVGVARATGRLAEYERRTGSPETAASYAALAVTELDRAQDRRSAAAVRRTLALLESAPGGRAAETHLLRALEDLRPAVEARSRAVTLTDLATLRVAGDRPAQAYAAVREALELLREVGGPRQVARALETTARILPHVGDGQQHRAARLLLTARVIRRHHRLPDPEETPALEKLLDRLRAAIGESTVRELRCQVEGTGPLAALNDALSAPPVTLRASIAADGDALQVLTPRQAQIARMVADGLTNRQIARALGLSEWTVINHLRQVMQKLKCPSRVHVARLVQQAAV